MRRTLLVPLLVVAAGAVAACAPVTAPAPPPAPPLTQYCAPSTPTSAAGYQAAFNALRLTYTEWATADGAVPVALDAGRTLWLFGDTLVGRVATSGGIPANTPMVSNSAVLQVGRCFTPLLGGTPLARRAWIADPAPDQGLWPSSAIVDSANDRLHVVLLHVQRPSTVVGTRIATFRLSTLALLGTTATLPGTSTARPYGSTTFADDTFAYLYSSNGGTFHVARAPLASVTDQSTWQYWTGPGDVWSAPGAFGAAQPLAFDTVTEEVGALDVSAPIAPLRVTRYGSGYLGTAMLVDAFTDRVLAYTAPTPFGPWTYVKDLARTPSSVMSYGAQTVLDLQGGTAPTLVYSTNLKPGETGFSIQRYGFRFVAVALPPAPTALAEAPATTGSSTTAATEAGTSSTEPSTTSSSTSP